MVNIGVKASKTPLLKLIISYNFVDYKNLRNTYPAALDYMEEVCADEFEFIRTQQKSI